MNAIKQSWGAQLVGCQRKGKEAFERGESRESCPYKSAKWAVGPGSRNLTKQRTQYWLYGYDTAAGLEAKEPQ